MLECAQRGSAGRREAHGFLRGDFLGDIALVTERPRTATATAITDSRLLVLGHREFHSLLDQFPGIRLNVLESIAVRLGALDPTIVH